MLGARVPGALGAAFGSGFVPSRYGVKSHLQKGQLLSVTPPIDWMVLPHSGHLFTPRPALASAGLKHIENLSHLLGRMQPHGRRPETFDASRSPARLRLGKRAGQRSWRFTAYGPHGLPHRIMGTFLSLDPSAPWVDFPRPLRLVSCIVPDRSIIQRNASSAGPNPMRYNPANVNPRFQGSGEEQQSVHAQRRACAP